MYDELLPCREAQHLDPRLDRSSRSSVAPDRRVRRERLLRHHAVQLEDVVACRRSTIVCVASPTQSHGLRRLEVVHEQDRARPAAAGPRRSRRRPVVPPRPAAARRPAAPPCPSSHPAPRATVPAVARRSPRRCPRSFRRRRWSRRRRRARCPPPPSCPRSRRPRRPPRRTAPRPGSGSSPPCSGTTPTQSS